MEMIPLHFIISSTPDWLFEIGNVLISDRALQKLRQLNCEPETFLTRHCNGDWGDIDAATSEENKIALKEGLSLMSRYSLPSYSHQLLIITDAERTRTTMFLPSEDLPEPLPHRFGVES